MSLFHFNPVNLELLKRAIFSLNTNKLRTLLTLIGIVIGITSIIAVISIINGLNLYVEEKIANLGKNVFVISRVGIVKNRQEFIKAIKKNKRLTLADSYAIKEGCTYCEDVGSEVFTITEIEYGNQSISDITLSGITPNIIEIEPYEIEEGRNINNFELERSKPVAFIGWNIVENLFSNIDPIGKSIKIKGIDFEVVGFAKKQGSVFGESRDNFVKIPISTFQKMYGAGRYSVNISVKVKSSNLMEEAQDQARIILRGRHHLNYKDEDDFAIITPEGITSLWNSLTKIIFTVTLLVVGISLVVGGIVIMNIMLVSVTERTVEIGICKAVGAKNYDILKQFIFESIILCCVGGVIGLFIGFFISYGVSKFTPLPSSFPWWSPILAFTVCTIIGIIFGIYPAIKASKLNPIQTLHSE